MRWKLSFASTVAVVLVALASSTVCAGGRAASPQLGSLSKIGQKAKELHDLEMTDDDEQKLGAGVSARIRQRYGVVQDPAVTKYVTLVGDVLAARSDRPGLPWKFIVLDTDGVNALAAPGGYIHITRGALALMTSEAQLAGVLGHEVIHVTEKHTIRAIQKGKAVQMGANETLSNSPALLNKLVDKATDAVMAGFGRGEELEADDKGVVVANKAGYDPKGLGDFLNALAERNKNSTTKQGLFASHPEMDERLKKLDSTIKSQKLASTVVLDDRFHQNVSYKPTPIAAVTTVEKGSAGIAGDSGKSDSSKGDDKTADDGSKKKKGGFGLSKLTGGGGEQKSAEVTGSGAARGVDSERNATGGPNPNPVAVKVTAAELTAFKKDGKLS